MKRICIICAVLVLAPVLVISAEPIFFSAWGFRLDIPEGYELTGGDRKNSFSFSSSLGTSLDLVVYTGKVSASALAEEIEKKLSSQGKRHVFNYNNKEAAVIELCFVQGKNTLTGWALCLELESAALEGALFAPSAENGATAGTYLAALAYGPDKAELECLHLSALDSIEGSNGDRFMPGAMTEFFHPRGMWFSGDLANSRETAHFRENDAEASQSVVDREFEVMKFYLDSPLWQEAWKRFYRAIFKDSFDRLKNAAFLLERSWNGSVPGSGGDGNNPENTEQLEKRTAESYKIAAWALEWVQGFDYERDLMGSDFVNLVTAAREGRGDCDSRAMLWAVILMQANIPSGVMVSREYSHALGIADIEGQGARFPMQVEGGRTIRWLVAETTANVSLGLIGETVSEVDKWLGILFE